MLPPSGYLELCDAVYCGRWLLIFRVNITPPSQDILKMEVVCYTETLRGGITQKIPVRIFHCREILRTFVNRKHMLTQFVLC
jgi:hypothetical protein